MVWILFLVLTLVLVVVSHLHSGIDSASVTILCYLVQVPFLVPVLALDVILLLVLFLDVVLVLFLCEFLLNEQKGFVFSAAVYGFNFVEVQFLAHIRVREFQHVAHQNSSAV